MIKKKISFLRKRESKNKLNDNVINISEEGKNFITSESILDEKLDDDHLNQNSEEMITEKKWQKFLDDNVMLISEIETLNIKYEFLKDSKNKEISELLFNRLKIIKKICPNHINPLDFREFIISDDKDLVKLVLENSNRVLILIEKGKVKANYIFNPQNKLKIYFLIKHAFEITNLITETKLNIEIFISENNQEKINYLINNNEKIVSLYHLNIPLYNLKNKKFEPIKDEWLIENADNIIAISNDISLKPSQITNIKYREILDFLMHKDNIDQIKYFIQYSNWEIKSILNPKEFQELKKAFNGDKAAFYRKKTYERKSVNNVIGSLAESKSENHKNNLTESIFEITEKNLDKLYTNNIDFNPKNLRKSKSFSMFQPRR